MPTSEAVFFVFSPKRASPTLIAASSSRWGGRAGQPLPRIAGRELAHPSAARQSPERPRRRGHRYRHAGTAPSRGGHDSGSGSPPSHDVQLLRPPPVTPAPKQFQWYVPSQCAPQVRDVPEPNLTRCGRHVSSGLRLAGRLFSRRRSWTVHGTAEPGAEGWHLPRPSPRRLDEPRGGGVPRPAGASRHSTLRLLP